MHVRQAEETNAKLKGLQPIPQENSNYSLLARLKSNDHIRQHEVFGYVCFASEPISSVSMASESTLPNPSFRNPCLRNPFFRNPFCRDPLFQNPFLSELIFGTWAKTRRMNISVNGCVSFLCGNGENFGTHFFGATHFSVFDFLGVLWEGPRLHSIFGSGLWGGGGGSQIEFGWGWAFGILTDDVCRCVSRSSRIMSPGPLRGTQCPIQRNDHFTNLDWFYF